LSKEEPRGREDPIIEGVTMCSSACYEEESTMTNSSRNSWAFGRGRPSMADGYVLDCRTELEAPPSGEWAILELGCNMEED
jgi:hypothetical protein